MTLSCGYTIYEDPVWYWYTGEDFTIMPDNEMTNCYSCNKTILGGEEVVKLSRARNAENEEEELRYGTWSEGLVPMPPYYLCQHCGEIFLTLAEAGFDESSMLDGEHTMQENLEFYWELTGFDPAKYRSIA